MTNIYKVLSYRRETTLQGELVLAKSGRLELGDRHYRHRRRSDWNSGGDAWRDLL